MAEKRTEIALINGPNLNLSGQREPEIYGSTTLDQIVESLSSRMAQTLPSFSLAAFQSNSEGRLVDEIQRAGAQAAAIIINPAAYSHTSIALRDALSATRIPIVEVHLSNIYRREEFRRHSLVSDVATGVISGFGWYGYLMALDALNGILLARDQAAAPGVSQPDHSAAAGGAGDYAITAAVWGEQRYFLK